MGVVLPDDVWSPINAECACACAWTCAGWRGVEWCGCVRQCDMLHAADERVHVLAS